MKVFFVYTNINGFHFDTYHFGLASIVSMARKGGHDVKMSIADTEADIPSVLGDVVAFAPKVIGFTSVSSQYGYVKQLAEMIKEHLPETIIVCGGVHPTINSSSLLETTAIDAFFIGESEFAFTEFLEKIENGEPYHEIENLAYVVDGAVKKNKLRPMIDDLDVLPFPDREIYPYQSTLEKVGHAPFFFSRGCPFLCTYCANHALAGIYGKKTNPVRDRSPEICIQEIEHVLGLYDVKAISVEDDVFGLNKKWRREFLRLYVERIKPRGVKFMCLLRVELAREDFIRELSEAGCSQIFFGVESGDEEIRTKMMARKMSNQTIIDAFDLCRKYGINTLAVNIIGVPGETKQQIWNTIKLNRRLKPTVSAVNIFYPYKGTVLGDQCFRDGLVNEEMYRGFSNERRDTVLNFPEAHRKLLVRYQQNWDVLVNPFHFRTVAVWALRKVGLFEPARRIKRMMGNVWAEDRMGQLKEAAGK